MANSMTAEVKTVHDGKEIVVGSRSARMGSLRPLRKPTGEL
jgi:hypothetical protein